MSVLNANCPSCGGPIEFKAGSTIVIVCNFCRSVVARTDRALEDLGKIAEIVQTQSPLKVGLKGKYLNQTFELTGRAQLKHQAGGVWDEWYATFSNGWVGWLAEAQGRFYITFYQPLPRGTQIPDYAALVIGQPLPVKIGENSFVVAEKGMAATIAAEGEIPYQLTPNETSYYADLSGPNKAFATIDYGMNPPFVFAGKEVSLEEIGLAEAHSAEREAKRVTSAGLNCPNCGGPINLRAPDATERVTCPNCDSLLDVQTGNLRYLKALLPEPHAYLLEIGAVANFPGKEPMQIIGAVTRSVTFDDTKYFWQEYLLYKPKIGFRWLVQSDNHWNWVEPVAAGDISFDGTAVLPTSGTSVKYNGEGPAKGKTFKIFQHATGTVEHVKGEFYWRVETGEQVLMTDYVNAPFMLSKEESKTGNSTEVNWSLGTYLPRETVEKAFNINNLHVPTNVGPNQPFPYAGLYKYGFALLGLFLVVAVLLIPLTGFSSRVENQVFTLPPMSNPNAPQIVFSNPFELKANRNIEIIAQAPVSNSWVSIDVDLVNEQNNEVESVPIDVEYYSGTEGGESWSEGSTQNSAYLSSLPAGKYTLRIEGSWQDWQQPMPVTVAVNQGATRGVNFICALILLTIVPVFTLIWQLTFESRRWSESSFSSE